MRNPYQILGVSESADMDEIKKAYRKLSRIYHPDANVNNPNKDQAEAKFKEIQGAYQQIVNERERGSSSNTYGQGTYGGFGGFGSYTETRQENQESTRMQAAGNYIRNGYYKEALNVLESMTSSERNAKWYYYSALANQGTGNNITATVFRLFFTVMRQDLRGITIHSVVARILGDVKIPSSLSIIDFWEKYVRNILFLRTDVLFLRRQRVELLHIAA